MLNLEPVQLLYLLIQKTVIPTIIAMRILIQLLDISILATGFNPPTGVFYSEQE
mgnify:CR=1 FL=1